MVTGASEVAVASAEGKPQTAKRYAVILAYSQNVVPSAVAWVFEIAKVVASEYIAVVEKIVLTSNELILDR